MARREGRLVALLTILGISTTCVSAAWAQSPSPVSPGSRTGVALTSDRCPTFLWTAVEAESVELVVFGVPTGTEDGSPERVLAVTLPGKARGWTPALQQCLESGKRYAWSVGVGGEWSEANLFEVLRVPGITEVEEAAVAELRRLASAPEEPRPLLVRTPELQPREIIRSETVAGSRVPLPSPSPSLVVDDQIHISTSSAVFRDGDLFMWADYSNSALGKRALSSNTWGSSNSAFGRDALESSTSGSFNSAFGVEALAQNTSAFSNSAFGWRALYKNETGYENTAVGLGAMVSNTDGPANTAVGYRALFSNLSARGSTAVGWRALEGSNTDANTAVGHEALRHATGHRNTAVGEDALRNATTGNRNVAIGENAGYDLTDGSDNLFILNTGAASDDKTIKIGTEGTQDRTFIAGVNGGVLAEDRQPVMVDSFGKLGTTTSSRRFKQGIRDLGAESERLLDLRPVSFRYRPDAIVGESPRTFGLVAEEVVEVFPELVVLDQEGQPKTVKYHLLSSLLLNELQKQHRQLRLQWLLIGGMLVIGVGLTVLRRLQAGG